MLRGHNPTHGYVPDGRGRLYALGWLVAGAVVFLAVGALVASRRHLSGDEVATLSLIDTHDLAGIIRVTNQWDVHPPLSYLVFKLLRPPV